MNAPTTNIPVVKSASRAASTKAPPRREKKIPPEVEAGLTRLADELTKVFGFRPTQGQVIGYLLRTRPAVKVDADREHVQLDPRLPADTTAA